jgi:hypothetical protein
VTDLYAKILPHIDPGDSSDEELNVHKSENAPKQHDEQGEKTTKQHDHQI